MLPQTGFFSHLPLITPVKRMHRFSCRVITGCLSSGPISLLHLEALLPPLPVTLTHKSLSFQRALRLPSSFPLASVTYFNPRTHLKKGSWRSFSCSYNFTPNLHLSREPLTFVLLNLPGVLLLLTLSHTNSLLHAFCNAANTSHLSPYPTAISLLSRNLGRE